MGIGIESLFFLLLEPYFTSRYVIKEFLVIHGGSKRGPLVTLFNQLHSKGFDLDGFNSKQVGNDKLTKL